MFMDHTSSQRLFRRWLDKAGFAFAKSSMTAREKVALPGATLGAGRALVYWRTCFEPHTKTLCATWPGTSLHIVTESLVTESLHELDHQEGQ
jgi:hypothetical protein